MSEEMRDVALIVAGVLIVALFILAVHLGGERDLQRYLTCINSGAHPSICQPVCP